MEKDLDSDHVHFLGVTLLTFDCCRYNRGEVGRCGSVSIKRKGITQEICNLATTAMRGLLSSHLLLDICDRGRDDANNPNIKVNDATTK